MIKAFKYIFAAGLMQLSVCTMMAQSLSTAELRQFRLDALRLIEDYEDNSPLSSYEQLAEYSNLFVNDSLMIYNDLLGVSTSKTLSVREYTSLLKSKAKNPKILVKNITSGQVYEDTDNWLMDVTFDKEVSYTDACEVLLSSKEYFGHDHKMKAVVAKDKSTGRCFIRSMAGSNESNQPILGKEYAVVLHSDKRDNDVKCNGTKLKFNSFDQAIVPANPAFAYSDPDVNMKVSRQSGSCEVYTLKFKPVRWRAKVYGGLTFGDFYKVSGGDSRLDVKSSETSIGLDLGYIFPTKGIVKIGFFVGAGYSMSKFELGVDQLNYNYAAGPDADMDRDNYNRYYELSDVKQTIKINSLVIPVYFDFDFRLARRFSIYAQGGVKGYMKMDSKASDMTADAYIYGIYPQYENLRLEETWLNDFGRKTLSSSYVNELEVKSFSFDAFAGLGFRVHIAGPLMLDCGVNYQFGITDCISNSGTLFRPSGGSISASEALVTYTVSGGEHMRSMTDAFKSVKRQGLKLNVGLMFKF